MNEYDESNYSHIKVIKSDGTQVKFDIDKPRKWADYATRLGIEGKTLLEETVERLPSVVTTKEIHSTMIDICIDKKEKLYSRIAARLEYATIRKAMMRNLGMNDKTGTFEDIYNKFRDLGVWDKNHVPEYKPEYATLYESLYDERFEYWQIKQWKDKYGQKYNGEVIETPHMGAIGIALSIHGDNFEQVKLLTKGIVTGKLNMPTPVINGCRNGDFDSISCCVIRSGDTIESIGVAQHVAYSMTAKKAGIGIRFDTRSLGNSVKNGAVEHLGKVPIYAEVDKAVKMFTQISRGGSATVTFSVYDPEVMELLMLKTQRIAENKRVDKIDYSMAFDNKFLDAVQSGDVIQTKSVDGTLGPIHKARDILKSFLMARQETGRIYAINVDVANDHTPFEDEIYQSNLCQEIFLPTKPYTDMYDLYQEGDSEGEIAFCSIGGMNISQLKPVEYEEYAECMVRTINKLIDKAPMMTESLKRLIIKRRSLGIGILGLADWLYNEGLSYADKDKIEEVAERHYYYLLKASIKLAEEGVYPAVKGIKKDWLPIDTKHSDKEATFDWESLRGRDRANSVLVAHMPTEASSQFSGAYNGLYPARQQIITKVSRTGRILFIGKPVKEFAWDLDNNVIADMYSVVQGYTDQGISADFYIVPKQYPGGKVPLSLLMKQFMYHFRIGNKSMYYQNTFDDNGGDFNSQISKDEEGCESGSCSL